MIRAKGDDFGSFSILLERNRRIVVGYLLRMVRNRAVAEELAQDVFMRIYRSRAAYRPCAKLSTWLYRITTNIGLNYGRS